MGGTDEFDFDADTLNLDLRDDVLMELLHAGQARGVTVAQQAAAVLGAWAHRQIVGRRPLPATEKVRKPTVRT